jgi:hypothetical protein
MYYRRVCTVAEVFDHLGFHLITRASDNTSPYFIKLFKMRLERYMHGVGHPPELRSRLPALGVAEEEFLAAQNDPLLRANLVLRCGSDLDMRPTQDDWSIRVR